MRPTGVLPKDIENPVSVRVSTQQASFDSRGQLIRPEDSEQIMPMFEATRKSRNTLLLGDLGTGKSTTAAQLVIDTLDKSPNTITILVPVKNLKLEGRFSVRELIQLVNNFLINEVATSIQHIDLEKLLDEHTEVLIVFDGLDELSQEIASRLLKKAAHFTENWPTIQTIATARPIELQSVSFDNWKVIHTASLNSERKQSFILEELVADGLDLEEAKQESKILIKKLEDQPELNSLASTPLTIRLIYPHLKNANPDKESTLGDLLYELLLMRLEDWQKRDDKPSNFDYFESIFPTAEAKMEFLSTLTMKAMEKSGISIDEAKAVFLDEAENYNKANKHLLVKEALSCFEWLGLITITDVVDFPLQSLAEMSAATGLLRKWKSQTSNVILPSDSQWRVVSFLTTIARRRGQLEDIRQTLHKYIQQLLLPSSPNLPAACYIVAESNDSVCAKMVIKLFDQLERRPLTFFGDDRRTSARNIAKTIWLAEEVGFDWLYAHYLDPKYPIINAGSAVITDVFKQWAAIVNTLLNTNQKQRLTKLVNPYLATEEAQFFGVLNILAVLVPEAFDPDDCLWYQSHSLDSPLFGDWVFLQFRKTSTKNQALLEKILFHKLSNSKKAASFWLKTNPDKEPPIPLIRHSLRLINLANSHNNAITEECIQRLGQDKWMRFVRWFLFDSDRAVATGATIVLYQRGEQRLSILGDVLIASLHDGDYLADAEDILFDLVQKSGDKGLRWLAFQISNCNDHYGAYSGLWRIFLAQVNNTDDGSKLLTSCVHKLGKFILPRYPEVREAFSQLLNGENGEDYKAPLRQQLYSLDPMVREGAAKILISTNPHTEGEALFIAVRSRANRNNHSDQHEWEAFCLSLSFSSGVLALLQSRLHLLDPKSRTLALFLLVKNSIEIQDNQYLELKSNLLILDNWRLARDPIGKSLLSTEESFSQLLSLIEEPTSKEAERAAEQLLELHSKRLSSKDKTKCIALKKWSHGWPDSLIKSMVKITTDKQFATVFLQVSQEIKAKGGSTSLLEVVLNASKGVVLWKDVLWAMLCDDTFLGSSSESEISGMALLEYGLIMNQYSKAIGAAAIECLADPRMKNNRWTDAYHWLAVIADEFTGLPARQIESILTKSGLANQASATTSLLTRLGYVPKVIEFKHSYRSKPNLSTDGINLKIKVTSLIQKLNDFSRDSETLHHDVIPIIEQSLYFSLLDNQVITNLGVNGKPGVLIATALRYCYGYPPKLFEAIPLLNRWGVNHTNDQTKKKLQNIWQTIRYSVHENDKEASKKYLEELDRRILSRNVWELSIAFELLQVRGYLLETQIEPIFIEYVNHTSGLHEHIFEKLIKWLSSELDETTKQTMIHATHVALVILNENTLYSSYGKDSKEWVFSIFPVIQWVLEKKQSPAAESVFLRSLQCALETSSITSLLSKLEPLLKRVPQHIIREIIISGKENPEPSIRAFCQMIGSFLDG